MTPSFATTTLFRASSPRSKNLLIVNKGPGAVTLSRATEDWDLLEIYFMPDDIRRITDNPATTDADHIVFETSRSMRKFAIVQRIFEAHDFWKHYDYIMIADDDLIPVGCRITDMFALFALAGCRVGQPALTHDSHFAHMITVRNENFLWRTTNFAEVMCPIFSRAGLEKYLPVFNGTVSGLNLDLFWGYNEWIEGAGLALLDATPMKHGRPIGGGIAYEGLSIEEDVRRFMRERGIPWYPLSCIDGVPVSPELAGKNRLALSLLGYAKRFDGDSRYLHYVVSETAIHNTKAVLRKFHGATANANMLSHIAAAALFMGGPHCVRRE